jgi:TRAP-type C4-dicarboxylate transport system permease small subunit
MVDESRALQIPEQAESDTRRGIDRFVAPLRRGTRRFGLALLFVMIALPALQVFLRGLLNQPLVGAEELARFLLICVVFVTLPYAVSSGASIRMEELLACLPRRLQWILRILITGTATAAFGVSALSVAVATLRNLDNATPSLGIPYWVFFSAAFYGLLFSAIESAVQVVKAITNRELYVAFAEEQPPDEPDLEQALSQAPSAGGVV